MEIELWENHPGKSKVKTYIKKLKNANERARIRRSFQQLEEFGDKALFETRDAKPFPGHSRYRYLRPGPHRLFYAVRDNVAYFLYAFKKQRGKDKKEMEKALKEYMQFKKEWI